MLIYCYYNNQFRLTNIRAICHFNLFEISGEGMENGIEKEKSSKKSKSIKRCYNKTIHKYLYIVSNCGWFTFECQRLSRVAAKCSDQMRERKRDRDTLWQISIVLTNDSKYNWYHLFHLRLRSVRWRARALVILYFVIRLINCL